MTNATYIPNVLRAAGLTVVEVPGWRDRGRPGTFDPRGVMVHHTSSNPHGGNTAALSTVVNGRPEEHPPLPGPLSQCLVARDGTWHVVAAGRCNHAGAGKWRGDPNGNSHFIGVECENNGTGEPWPDGQLRSIIRGVGALLTQLGADDSMVCGHKEYATPKGRKVDPNFDMISFRERVAAYMTGVDQQPGAVPDANPPEHSMLRKGDSGGDVRKLQQLLNQAGATLKLDSDFGPTTEKAVKAFQRQHGLFVDGKVGPKTWAALGVK